MTWLLLVFSILVAGRGGAPPEQAVQAPDPAATAKIAGRVVAADSGKPIRGASLRLLSFEVLRVPRTVVTDADGRFEFTGLLPGQYQLDATAERHLPASFGQLRPSEPGRPIDLTAGQQFANADFALARVGAIEGAVVDEFGDPVPNVAIVVYRSEYAAGRQRLMPIGSATATRPTDDKGRFRLYNLAPADYYVGAMTGVFTDTNELGGFAPTFYPGVTDPSLAKPVRLGIGQTVANLTFALFPTPMATVSGRLVDDAGQPVPNGTVMLMPSDRQRTQALVIGRVASDGAGRFRFRNVPSGSFTIQAFGRPEGGGNLGRAPFGWLPVPVAGENVEHLDVRVTPGAVVRGRIVFEGDAKPPAPGDISVAGMATDFDSSPIAGGPPNFQVRPDWTFELRNMSGQRVLRPSSRIPGWSTKRVTILGQDITDANIDFRSGDVNDVEIVMTSRNGVIAGSVVDGNGAPLSNCSVIVFAAGKDRWRFPSRFVQLARPNQSGEFRATGLPPESYLAVAVPTVQGLEWQDPSFLDALRGFATVVTIIEGDTKTVSLRVVSR